MTAPPALHLEGITKRFGAVRALTGASLTARPGTVHAVLGENGAGKTTLMRVAYGLVAPDAGVIRVHGARVRLASPAAAIRAGVGMVHQHFTLVPSMTVAENVALGGHGTLDARAAAERVRAVTLSMGLPLDPGARAGDLPVGAQQRLEIVKALAREASIIILDEPTAVLAPAEIEELLGRLRGFADAGRTVLLITHKLREALSIADDVTVLRGGRTVLTVPARAASEDQLAEAMLGPTRVADAATGATVGASRLESPRAGAPPDIEDAPESRGHRHHSAASRTAAPRSATPDDARIVIRAEGLAASDARGRRTLRHATLEVAGGEILGVVGIEGAGHRELLRVLAGRQSPLEGHIELPPEVGFVPEDRHRDALILDFSLVENIALHGAGARRGRLPWRELEARTSALVATYDVRAPGSWVAARALSGGNQQKLVLARELERAPAALVAENPTRGLDIQATAAVHARLRAARARGVAVVVYSSDLDEVLGIADRVLVAYDGRVREVGGGREAVGRAMLGVG